MRKGEPAVQLPDIDRDPDESARDRSIRLSTMEIKSVTDKNPGKSSRKVDMRTSAKRKFDVSNYAIKIGTRFAHWEVAGAPIEYQDRSCRKKALIPCVCRGVNGLGQYCGLKFNVNHRDLRDRRTSGCKTCGRRLIFALKKLGLDTKDGDVLDSHALEHENKYAKKSPTDTERNSSNTSTNGRNSGAGKDDPAGVGFSTAVVTA